MVSRFAAVTKKEISQIIKRAVPEIHKEDDEIQFEVFTADCSAVYAPRFLDMIRRS